LSKSLVELMKGEIGVESEPGNGSTFWVRLPIAEAKGMASAKPRLALEGGQAGEGTSLSQRVILYIEDNPANMRLLERLLENQADIRFLGASMPEQGIEMAIAEQPELILLDINLPGMTGFDVLEILRRNPATHDIPVVAISANAMQKDIEHAKAAGFAEYLAKPLDLKRLQAVMESLLAD
jgi:CheY-like chemotaxis protein